jgi:hypothetical protein
MTWCAVWLLGSGLALGHRGKYGFVIPGTEEVHPKNQFSAFLLLSDEPDEIIGSWKTASAPGLPIATAETIARGVPIVAFIFFAGCEPDENGFCNASADFTILKPDGSVYDRFSDRELWKQKPAPPQGTLRLSAEYVGVILDREDPLGTYEIRVSVHDLNAGKTIDLSQAFTATETP